MSFLKIAFEIGLVVVSAKFAKQAFESEDNKELITNATIAGLAGAGAYSLIKSESKPRNNCGHQISYKEERFIS